MREIDGITLLEQLGQGGMGTVYRARHPRLGVVALKLLQGLTADDVIRFEREARAAARVRHPHVLGVHLVGHRDGLPYLVMPLVEGESLYDRIRRQGPLPELVAARLGVQLAGALAAIHGEGILHRDIKPANVFLDEHGEPRLGDFGLALLVGGERLTQTGEVLGSPNYMAPEQACGERERMGPPTDVYGLGATLYHALAGHEPIQAPTVAATLEAVANARVTPLRQHRPEVAPELEGIVMRCLAKEPEDRYPDGRALERALTAFLQRSDPRLRPATRRATWAARVGAGALLGLGVGASAWILTRDPSRGPGQASPPRAVPTGTVTAATPLPSGAAPAVPGHGEHVLALQPGPLLGVDTCTRGFGYYLNDNYGCEQTLVIGYRAGPSAGSQQGPYRGYLRFDLERLPSDAEVHAAVLRLSTDGHTLDAMPIQAWLLDGPWVEGTSTQDEHLDGLCVLGDLPAGVAGAGNPAVDSDRPELSAPGPLESRPFVEAWTAEDDRPLELDLTEAVRTWQADPARNFGFALTTDEQRAPNRWIRRGLMSSDAVDPRVRPLLTIRYTGSPAGPDRESEACARADEDLAATVAECRRVLDSWSGDEGPGQQRELLNRVSAVIARAPHSWRGFALRGEVFDRLNRSWAYSSQSGIRALRHASMLAPEEHLPELRAQMIALLREIWATPGDQGGPERVDEQLVLMQGIAWDELRQLRDEVHRVLPNPRRWEARSR